MIKLELKKFGKPKKLDVQSNESSATLMLYTYVII